MMAAKFGGDLWGSNTNITDIEAARTYFNTKYGALTSSKVAVIGGSMGGAAAMAWARANPTKCACLVLMLPVCDLNDMVVNNRLGLAASINAAYGGAYNNGTDGPNHSPVQFAAQLSGIPTQIWYATDDIVVIPSTVQTVIAAHGSAEVHTITGNHTDAAFANINAQAIIDFLKAHPGS
jgi:pimeloyl-ACP methyl ester carboxylesterase